MHKLWRLIIKATLNLFCKSKREQVTVKLEEILRVGKLWLIKTDLRKCIILISVVLLLQLNSVCTLDALAAFLVYCKVRRINMLAVCILLCWKKLCYHFTFEGFDWDLRVHNLSTNKIFRLWNIIWLPSSCFFLEQEHFASTRQILTLYWRG